MVNWIGLSTYREANRKIVQMDWLPLKKLMLSFVILIFGITLSVFSFSDTAKINGQEVVFNSFEEKLPILGIILIVFIIFMLLGMLLYYPLKVILMIDRNGNLTIKKSDWFFIINEYYVRSSQEPGLIAKKRLMVGTTIYLGRDVYQPLIRFNDNGETKEINLIFYASYFMKGLGPRGILSKEQAEEISRFLGIKLKIE